MLEVHHSNNSNTSFSLRSLLMSTLMRWSGRRSLLLLRRLEENPYRTSCSTTSRFNLFQMNVFWGPKRILR